MAAFADRSSIHNATKDASIANKLSCATLWTRRLIRRTAATWVLTAAGFIFERPHHLAGGRSVKRVFCPQPMRQIPSRRVTTRIFRLCTTVPG